MQSKGRITLLTIAVLVSLVLSGLSLPVAAQEDPVEEWLASLYDEFAGTELVLGVASHPSVEAFKEMIPRFEELTGVRVLLDELEEGQLGERLTLEVASGSTSWDIAMIAIERNPRVADAGYTIPLEPFMEDPEQTPEWFDYEDILAAYRDMFLWEDGQHYAIPFAGETVFQFYRTDLFEEHDIAVPTTFDEVLAVAQYFDENVDGVDGISFRARLGWEFTYSWSIFLFPFGGRMVDPMTGEVALNAPGTADSLSYLIELAQYAPVGIESFSFPEAWDSFMLGRAAMMIEASAAAPEVEDPDKSVVAGNVGYAPMPAGPEGAFSGVWGWGFGITAGSENQEAAWALIAYLTGRGTQDEYLANGGIVSRASALLDPELQEQNTYYGAILETLEQAADLNELGLSVVLPITRWNEFSEILGNDGARAFIGEITVEEAIESMQAQAEDLMSNE